MLESYFFRQTQYLFSPLPRLLDSRFRVLFCFGRQLTVEAAGFGAKDRIGDQVGNMNLILFICILIALISLGKVKRIFDIYFIFIEILNFSGNAWNGKIKDKLIWCTISGMLIKLAIITF